MKGWHGLSMILAIGIIKQRHDGSISLISWPRKQTINVDPDIWVTKKTEWVPTWNLGLALYTDCHYILPFCILQESLAKKGICEEKAEPKDRTPSPSIRTEATVSTTGVSEDCVGGEEILRVVWKPDTETGMMANEMAIYRRGTFGLEAPKQRNCGISLLKVRYSRRKGPTWNQSPNVEAGKALGDGLTQGKGTQTVRWQKAQGPSHSSRAALLTGVTPLSHASLVPALWDSFPGV